MELLDVIAPQLVFLDCPEADKESLLKRIAGEFSRHTGMDAPDELYKKILEREAVMSTGIGGGVALPHAKHDKLTRIHLAFARCHAPIEFKALDGRPVDLVFLLAGPASESAQHVRLLGKLARLLKKAEFVSSLRDLKNGEDLPALIRMHERA